jgi:hypothetical protein
MAGLTSVRWPVQSSFPSWTHLLAGITFQMTSPYSLPYLLFGGCLLPPFQAELFIVRTSLVHPKNLPTVSASLIWHLM